MLRQDRCRLEKCVGGPVVDVLACELHRECTPRQHAIPGVKVCTKCPDRAETAAAPVAVVITSHNYGRFLAECLESVLVARPAEVVVVDDSSTDDTREVAERFAGVRYLRVEFENVVPSRGAGFAATAAPYVCFVDADDKIGPRYLANAARILQAEPRVGIVWTDMLTFGADSGRMVLPRDPARADLRVENYVHASAVFRRAVGEYPGAFDRPKLALSLEDWEFWRRAERDGWEFRKSPDDSPDGVLHYRKHAGSMSWRIVQREATYFDLYAMPREVVTIVLPLSGRWEWLPRLMDWCERQTWPNVRILVVDSSQDERFGRAVRGWLVDSRAVSVAHHKLAAGLPGIADADRRKAENYDRVRKAMPHVYNRVRALVEDEFALVVEDDILPPLDAIERLLRSMAPDVAAVSGAYRSRFQDAWVAWPKHSPAPFTVAHRGVEEVGGTGFGCLLVRASALQRVMFRADDDQNFDPEFGKDMRRAGLRVLLDWSVICDHAGDGAATSTPSAACATPTGRPDPGAPTAPALPPGPRTRVSPADPRS